MLTTFRLVRPPLTKWLSLSKSYPRRIQFYNSTSHRLFSSSRAFQSYPSPPPRKPRRPYEAFIPTHPWRRIGLGICIGGVLIYVLCLEETPVTKRSRFMIISPEVEKFLARHAHQALLEEFEGRILPDNHPITLYIRDIVSRLLEGSNLGRLKDDPAFVDDQAYVFGEPSEQMDESTYGGKAPKEWKLLVVNSHQINASAMFDTIVVFLGIIPVAGNEDNLAAVLSHEIAHIVARHPAEALSSRVVSITLNWLIIFLSYAFLGFGTDFGGAVTTLTLDLPNSRTQEKEADYIGLLIASRACFDPSGGANIQRRLDQIEKANGRAAQAGFLLTHPPSDQRAKILDSLIPLGESVAAESGCRELRHYKRQFDDAKRTLGRGELVEVILEDGRPFVKDTVEDETSMWK